MTHAFTEEQEVPRMTPAVQWLIALIVLVFFLQFTLIGTTNMREALGFRLDEQPARAGIDPYNKLIDRVSGDNVVAARGQ